VKVKYHDKSGKVMTMKIVVAAMLLAVFPCPLAARAGELPSKLTDKDLLKIVRDAPEPSVDLDLGLKLRLIDFIDCTNPNDPHEFRDQGTSKVVEGPAGKYRVTAPHRHAFFSYRHHSPGTDKPMLIVSEYPDDAERTFTFMTWDSTRPGKVHASFSPNPGVYSGYPFPLSNKMQYLTQVSWSRDAWPTLTVANYAPRGGGNAAARRIWVYAIEGGFPTLELDIPDPSNPRILANLHALDRNGTYDTFGHHSKRAHKQGAANMVDYYRYIGVNRVTLMIYANHAWGANCMIPSWDADDSYLDEVLQEMDTRGDVGLVAGIVAEGTYGIITHQGTHVRELSDEEFRKVMLKGFEEFLDHYGHYKSLQGIALGSMEAVGFCDLLQERGILEEVVALIKKKRPNLEVITYLGNYMLQKPYFRGPGQVKNPGYKGLFPGPDTLTVINEWENSGQTLDDFLGDSVLKLWKRWGRDPAVRNKIPGLTVYDMYHPDEHRIHQFYTQDPRAMLYFDINNSQQRSDHVASPYAAMFAAFDEGWLGLQPNYNFWYKVTYTVPDEDPAGALALYPFAQVMAHRDRLGISAGTCAAKYFGDEVHIRRFARAYYALPPVQLNDVSGLPLDTLKVRWVRYQDKRYVSIVSRIPFASEIVVDGNTVRLQPYDLVTLVDEGKVAPKVTGTAPAEYRKWVEERIARFRKLYKKLKALQAEAAPAVYLSVANEAEKLLNKGKAYSADMHLGYGLENELKVRLSVLMPPKLSVPKIKAPSLNGDLNVWPEGSADVLIEGGKYLTSHLYFPNSWHGAQDLSTRMRLGHDGKKLYVGIEVRDDVIHEKDAAIFNFSKDGYLNWKSRKVDPDLTWKIPAPEAETPASGKGSNGFTYTCRRTPTGYLVEGSAPLDQLGLRKERQQKTVGFILQLHDRDGTENLSTKYVPGGQRVPRSWALKQSMLYPNRPYFNQMNWTDARNSVQLVFEK